MDYQEFATEDYNRKKKVLKPEDLIEVLEADGIDKVMEVYKTLGNCNFVNIGADITKLEVLSLVIVTNNYPSIMRIPTNEVRTKAKKEVFKLVAQWYSSGNRRYLELSTQIVEVLEKATLQDCL